ncbi:MAG TPA: glycosyltransferase family 1 protein [Myxococcaceae bacterium]|nr:glycosyltransferase family 1 protein [Myxococcaceae bacterium]
MRILVNATSARLGGGITVLRNLLPALAAVDGGRHEYTVVALADVAQAMDPGNPRIRFVPFRHKGLGARFFWEQLSLPVRATLSRADVLFCPANIAVPGARVPQVLMFQNMAPFDPRVVSGVTGSAKRRLSALRWLSIATARAATRLVFISRFAQRWILPQLHVSAAGTDCVYLGRDVAFTPAALERAPATLAGLGLRRPYVLSVSHFYHYKNFVELVHGFARARSRLPPEAVLAIAGGESSADYAARVRRAIAEAGVQSSVKLLGEVPYADLPPLYAAAHLFAFPSSCENFPNILVEGLASGAPTLASRVGPMQEIAGDGAAYFDPFNPDDIGRIIADAWSDAPRREALRQRGIAQAGRYDWEATARQLLPVLERAGGRLAAS